MCIREVGGRELLEASRAGLVVGKQDPLPARTVAPVSLLRLKTSDCANAGQALVFAHRVRAVDDLGVVAKGSSDVTHLGDQVLHEFAR